MKYQFGVSNIWVRTLDLNFHSYWSPCPPIGGLSRCLLNWLHWFEKSGTVQSLFLENQIYLADHYFIFQLSHYYICSMAFVSIVGHTSSVFKCLSPHVCGIDFYSIYYIRTHPWVQAISILDHIYHMLLFTYDSVQPVV